MNDASKRIRYPDQSAVADHMVQACLALCGAISVAVRNDDRRSFPAQAIMPALDAHLLAYTAAAEEVEQWQQGCLTGVEIESLCESLGPQAPAVRERLVKYLPNPTERIKAELRQLSAASGVASAATLMCSLLVGSRPTNDSLVSRALRCAQQAIDCWHAACEAPASLRPDVEDQ